MFFALMLSAMSSDICFIEIHWLLVHHNQNRYFPFFWKKDTQENMKMGHGTHPCGLYLITNCTTETHSCSSPEEQVNLLLQDQSILSPKPGTRSAFVILLKTSPKLTRASSVWFDRFTLCDRYQAAFLAILQLMFVWVHEMACLNCDVRFDSAERLGEVNSINHPMVSQSDISICIELLVIHFAGRFAGELWIRCFLIGLPLQTQIEITTNLLITNSQMSSS
jgi:hypothetical protein